MKHHKETHGQSAKGRRTAEYRAWANMKSRCSNPNASYYDIYGGRGITYCQEWEHFEAFFSDMGKAPDKYTLERVDVNKGYSKDNCIWADRHTQAVNIRKRKDNTSGYIGVKKSGNSWLAVVRWLKREHYLGSFKDPELAALVRDEYIIKHNLPHMLNN